MNSFFTAISDFFLPRFCPSCSSKLSVQEKSVCEKCLNTIQVASCERLKREFERKFECDKIISDFFSLFVFEKDKALQDIIHSFKYNKRYQNAIYLGEILGSAIDNKLKLWKINYIIPVPLHSVKKAERGYNQSYYIAKGISKVTSFPVLDNLLKRERFTESQTTMTLLERKQNINNAFIIKNNKHITGKNILLLDDVITMECPQYILNQVHQN